MNKSELKKVRMSSVSAGDKSHLRLLGSRQDLHQSQFTYLLPFLYFLPPCPKVTQLCKYLLLQFLTSHCFLQQSRISCSACAVVTTLYFCANSICLLENNFLFNITNCLFPPFCMCIFNIYVFLVRSAHRVSFYNLYALPVKQKGSHQQTRDLFTNDTSLLCSQYYLSQQPNS